MDGAKTEIGKEGIVNGGDEVWGWQWGREGFGVPQGGEMPEAKRLTEREAPRGEMEWRSAT
jgi:hypothetical protein